jgi:hypothetical protein
MNDEDEVLVGECDFLIFLLFSMLCLYIY